MNCQHHFVFETLSGELRSNVGYTVYLRLIGKLVVVPIRVNWTYFATCYGWGDTSKYWLEIGVFEGAGQFWPNFYVEGGVPHELYPHGYIGQWLPYNFLSDGFHTKKLAILFLGVYFVIFDHWLYTVSAIILHLTLRVSLVCSNEEISNFVAEYLREKWSFWGKTSVFESIGGRGLRGNSCCLS